MNRWTFGNNSLILSMGYNFSEAGHEGVFGLLSLQERASEFQGLPLNGEKPPIEYIRARSDEEGCETVKFGFRSSAAAKMFANRLYKLSRLMKAAEEASKAAQTPEELEGWKSAVEAEESLKKGKGKKG